MENFLCELRTHKNAAYAMFACDRGRPLMCANVRKPCYFSKRVAANVCDGWPGCFDSSSALCSAQPPGSLSHLMKKRVDLLQVTDAENRLTQLGCTFPISCTTKASTEVVGMRGGKH